jgi:O-antigen/teichoic acid export membrane protein
MGVHRRLVEETLVLASAQLVALGVGFLSTVLITRALGPEGRGLYAWILTLVGVAVQVAALVSNQTVRAVSPQVGEDRAFVATVAALSLFGTLLGLPLLAYAVAELPGSANPGLIFVAWVAVPLTGASIPLIALVQIGARPWPMLVAHVGSRAVILAVVAGLWAASALDLAAAVWINTAAAGLQLAILLFLLRERMSFRPRLALAGRLASRIGAGWIAALALFALPRASLVMLGSRGLLAEAGYYSVAVALFELLCVVPVSASGVLTSHLAGRPELRAGRRSAFALLSAMGVLSLVAAVLAPALIPLVFGVPFTPAVGPFQAILPAVILATLHQFCHGALQASGRPVPILLPPVLGLLAAVPVAWLLVPSHGALGAVISTVAGTAVLAAAALVSMRRSLPAHPGTDPLATR